MVEDLEITTRAFHIILIWTPVYLAQHYHIYRSTEPHFDISGMTPLATAEGTEYTDEEALPEKGYFSRVTIDF